MYGNLSEAFHPSGYEGKAFALKELGDWNGVLECYDKLIEYNPRNGHNHCGRADALLQLERIPEAMKSIEVALHIHPSNACFLCTKSMVVAASGDRAATEVFYNTSLISQCEFINSADRYLQKASAMNVLGDSKEAIRNCDLAIHENPRYYQAYKTKGLILHSLGDNNKALECLNAAMKINPNYILAYKCKSAILCHIEKYWEAIQCCDKIIAINANDADNYNNKGWYLSLLGEYELALKPINLSLAINPNSANAHHSKCVILSGLRMYDDAINSFDKALELDSNFKDAHTDKAKYMENRKSIKSNNNSSMSPWYDE